MDALDAAGAKIDTLWYATERTSSLGTSFESTAPAVQRCNKHRKNGRRLSEFVGRYDIEIESWDPDVTTNQAFVQALLDATPRHQTAGVYTSTHSWSAIVGGDWTEAKKLPLWYFRRADMLRRSRGDAAAAT